MQDYLILFKTTKTLFVVVAAPEEAVHHHILVVVVPHVHCKVLEVLLDLSRVEGALGSKQLEQ